MANTTFEKINEYIENHKSTDKITLDYGTFQAFVKTSLTIAEQTEFINTVVENAYVDFTPSQFNVDIAFEITFMQMFTDLPVPTKTVDGKETVDVEKAYGMAKGLELISVSMAESEVITVLLSNLRRYINKAIEYKNQQYIACISSTSDEVINSMNTVIHRAVDFFDALINQLDKNGNKLFKHLTPKNITAWSNSLQKKFIESVRQKDGYAVIKPETPDNAE